MLISVSLTISILTMDKCGFHTQSITVYFRLIKSYSKFAVKIYPQDAIVLILFQELLMFWHGKLLEQRVPSISQGLI